MSALWVSEFGTIRSGDRNRVLENGDLQLKKTDFDALLSLTEPTGDEAAFDQMLSLYRRNGLDFLKVRNYVGVIRAPSGVQIEVLPKTSRTGTDPDLYRQLLIKMLLTLRNSPFKKARAASLELNKMPLFELVMRYFLDEVVYIVKRGIARSYIAQEDNLRFLRGKLMLREDIKRNVANRANFYCEFDEYNEDRPVNRLIRGALEVVAKCSNEPGNVGLCRELKHVFDNVTPTTDHALDFARIRRDRSIQHYNGALPICELILKGLNPLTQQGSKEVFSLLFPMERVFEDYVATKLSHQFPTLQVKAQVSSSHLVHSHGETERQMFRLKPDIELTNSGIHLIADTKWKLLNEIDVGRKYQIKESDMYQLFSYGEKYLQDQNCFSALVLIYPLTDQFTSPLPTFWFDRDQTKGLYVLPYDLEKDELVLAYALAGQLGVRDMGLVS